MRKFKGTLLTFLAQQSGQIQLLIVAPILTLSFLSLVVRTASPAVDSSLEKRKVTEQLKRRLSEVHNEQSVPPEEQKTLAGPNATPLSSLLHTAKENTPDSTLQQSTLITPPQPTVTSSSLAQQLLPPLQVSIKVEKKMTISSILANEGIEKDESHVWLTVIKKEKALKKLIIGRTLRLSFALTKKENDRELRSLSYELGKRSHLILEKQINGKIIARTETLPISLVWKGIGGRISGSLYQSALNAGVPRQLIDDIADLDWDIDLASDLREGDTFKVLFEEFRLDGKLVGFGKLLAAEIHNKGKTYTLFSFPEPREITIPGQGLGKPGSFLRYPLRFTRITSMFTDARLHPILERVRPHTGVDFAAPRGTPIRSIADGKVIFAGRQSGYGIIIRIDHPGPYDSAYAHLDRIAMGVKKGKSVEKGQVIGFVGSTGLATGPHLHFEMYENGKFINPLTAKIPREDNFQKKENPVFVAKKQQALAQLSAMRIEDRPVVLARVMARESDSRNLTKKEQDDRLAMALSSDPSSLIPGLSSATKEFARKKVSTAKTASFKSRRSHASSARKATSSKASSTARR